MKKLLMIAMASLMVITSSVMGIASPSYAARSTQSNAVQTQASAKVYFNTQTHKYHDPSCRWAQRCTQHCILIPESEAIQRGGIPCKVCGG